MSWILSHPTGTGELDPVPFLTSCPTPGTGGWDPVPSLGSCPIPQELVIWDAVPSQGIDDLGSCPTPGTLSHPRGLVGQWDPVPLLGSCPTPGTGDLGASSDSLVPMASSGGQAHTCCSFPGGICSPAWGQQSFGFAKECSGQSFASKC